MESAIYSALSSNSALTAIAGEEIWPTVRDDDDDTKVDNYVIFALILAEEEYDESATTTASFSPGILQIDLYSTTHANSRAMANAVENQFKGQAITTSNYQFQRFERQSWRASYEDETSLHRVTLEFNFNYLETEI